MARWSILVSSLHTFSYSCCGVLMCSLPLSEPPPPNIFSLWITHISINCNLTISKRRRTSFSDSPLYLEVRVDEETLKKVVLHSVATALANRVFPVPGGPTMRTPWSHKERGERSTDLRGDQSCSLPHSTFHGLLMPLKKAGIHMGKTTASFRSFLASSKSAMLSLKTPHTKELQHTGRSSMMTVMVLWTIFCFFFLKKL